MNFIILLCALTVLVCQAFTEEKTDDVPPVKWYTCNTTAPFKVTKVKIEPYPVEAGKNATVTAWGDQAWTFRNGTWETGISRFGHVWQTEKGDVCGLDPDCPCPCAPGFRETTITRPVLKYAPSGEYSGKFVATDTSGNQLSCIFYTFYIKGIAWKK